MKNLPGLEVHCHIDRIYLGRTFPKLHRALDRSVKVLGKRHRVLYHDYASAIVIAKKEYPGDRDAERAAILHIQYDEICSKDPAYRKLLEIKAKEAAEERRRQKAFMSMLKGKSPKKPRKRKKQQSNLKPKKAIQEKEK